MTDKKKSYDLATITEAPNAVAIFVDGSVNELLGALREELLSVVPDVTTAKGRKEIASRAHKASRSKTAVDGAGKELVSSEKARIKLIDNDRKTFRDGCDALRDEIRAPLTAWEEAEKERIAAEQLAKEIEEAHGIALAENELFDRERKIAEQEAEAARIAEEQRQKAEQERLAAEQVERERVIAENARLEAERKAEAEKQKAIDDAAKAKAAEEQAIRDKAVAEQLAEAQRVQAAKDAEERRLQAIKDTEEKAKREAEQREQLRLAQEADAKEEAERKAANVQHQKQINHAILSDLCELGLTEELAKEVIKAAAKGKIKHLSVNY